MSDQTPADPQTVTYEGIDVSHYQGDVDWAKVKAAGIVFAFCKASQGAHEVDPRFSANWAAMKAAAVVRGAYHFFDPSVDAEAQAEHFIATVQLEAGDLPPALDVEVTEGATAAAIAAAAHAWLEKVAASFSVTPILYSGLSFLEHNLATGFGSYPLWVAEYADHEPVVPSAWSAWTMWQYSQSGTVDGVAGAVDRDRYRGTTAGWGELLVPAAKA